MYGGRLPRYGGQILAIVDLAPMRPLFSRNVQWLNSPQHCLTRQMHPIASCGLFSYTAPYAEDLATLALGPDGFNGDDFFPPMRDCAGGARRLPPGVWPMLSSRTRNRLITKNNVPSSMRPSTFTAVRGFRLASWGRMDVAYRRSACLLAGRFRSLNASGRSALSNPIR